MAEQTQPTREDAPRRPGLLRAIQVLVGLAPVVLAVASVVLAEAPTPSRAALAAVLVALYIYAFRSEFMSSRGSAVPTEPVLVAMALTLPTQWLPPLGLMAVLLGSIGLDVQAPGRLQWFLSATRSAWNIVAFAIALHLMHVLAPGTDQAVTIAVAVAAQVVGDAAQVLTIEHLDGGARQVLRPVAWTYQVDILLAVVGYCIVTTVGASMPWVALVITPVLLMRLLAYDREQYFQEARNLSSAFTEVEEEARRDAMTGLLNRRGWEEVLAETESLFASAPTVATATVLVADLDRLKFANDTYGHLAGDSLICGFADLLAEVVPPDAAVARLGGDEFAVVVTRPVSTPALDLLGLVRARVTAAAPIGPVQISASLGQATYPPAADLAAAVDDADHAARVDKTMRRMTREHHVESA